MKVRVYISLFFSLCLGQVFSQELKEFSLVEVDETFDLNIINQEFEAPLFSTFAIGSDAFTAQLLNYTNNKVSVGFAARIEEELPYEDSSYDYNGFYYLDFGFSYNVGDFSFGLSLENILNFSNTNFAIEPNVEVINNIQQTLYYSQEADALALLSITFNF
ncbi:hypothetical protein [uncultured Winogradskyella sp.]|uniref:hypothetical protein n=1 Tax=uncultured Winogradskyella sp. TaxID=395353 RepID=UPI00260C3125|nr:hypothetical protein [uncultured Winogradskyella sp.]